MTSTEPRLVWEKLLVEQPGAQRRFEKHPLRLHYGTDNLGRPILLLRLDAQPEAPELGKAVGVEVGQRSGYGEWTMVLTLREQALAGTFMDLCTDLADRSAQAQGERDALRLFHRALQEHKDLLVGGSTRPSLEKIRGLVGELWFALRVLAPQVGPAGAVLAWGGPLGAAHDFRDSRDALFEIKAIHAEARSITISSVEQLDPVQPSPLTLVTVSLEEREPGSHDAVSAGSLISEFRDALVEHAGMLDELERRLEAIWVNDLDPAHDRSFAVIGCRHYAISEGFPRLMRNHVPQGIQGVTYRIPLSSITSYEVGPAQAPEET